ncbi:MAG: glycosyltransferase [Verrucomicrobia bacterium]|nr:glycosyltransferase [Verrucomicrobiota bacterium]
MPLAFSVIVPTYNRPDLLAQCLAGLAALKYPRARYEVIVVNDGGVEPPAEMATGIGRRISLRVLSQPNKGPAAARNLGATHAEGEWLVFTDDDCVPAPDWLTTLEARLTAQPSCVVGGNVLNGLPGNVYAEASQQLFAFLYDYYHVARTRKSQRPFLTTNNLALARPVFDRVGGMDERMRFGEDRDFCVRLASAGAALVYAPEARVHHFRALSAGGFWRQHVSYGTGAYAYHLRLKERGQDTLRPEPLGFYWRMLRHPWTQTSGCKATQISALIILSQVANVCGFFSARFADRARR